MLSYPRLIERCDISKYVVFICHLDNAKVKKNTFLMESYQTVS